MARALVKCTFAALLALISMQAVVPSTRAVPDIEIVCLVQAEHPLLWEAGRIQTDPQIRQPAPNYVSRPRPEPDTAASFQRPPPILSLFA